MYIRAYTHVCAARYATGSTGQGRCGQGYACGSWSMDRTCIGYHCAVSLCLASLKDFSSTIDSFPSTIYGSTVHVMA